MDTSQYISENLNEDFIQAMINLHSELDTVKKDCTGQTGNRKFSYANLESIWSVLQPLVVKNNLWFSQEVTTINDKEFLISSIYHKSGGFKKSIVEMKYQGNDIKLFGGSISFYRRYLIMCLFCIVCSEDIDPEKSSLIQKNSIPKEKLVDRDQADVLADLFQLLDQPRQNIAMNALRELGVNKFVQLTAKDFDSYAKFLCSLRDQQQNEFAREVEDV